MPDWQHLPILRVHENFKHSTAISLHLRALRCQLLPAVAARNGRPSCSVSLPLTFGDSGFLLRLQLVQVTIVPSSPWLK